MQTEATPKYSLGVTAKEKLRHLADVLTEQQAKRALVVVEREVADPLVRFLDEAPLDDEPSNPDEDAGADDAMAEYRRGESFSAEEIKRELG